MMMMGEACSPGLQEVQLETFTSLIFWETWGSAQRPTGSETSQTSGHVNIDMDMDMWI